MNSSKLILAVLLAVSIGVIGCAQKPKTANSNEAIEQAKSLPTPEEQAKFLVGEANAFINSDQFDEAIKAAKYVLSKLDSDSQEAKSILEKAQAELKAYAEKKAAEAKAELKKKLDGFGK